MQLRDHLLGRAGEWMFAKTTPKRFLEHLESHLRTVAPGRESDLVSRIRARAGEVADADADLVSDKASEGLLVTSATVLAAFEELEPEIGDRARTIAFLQHVFVESIEHTSSLSTRLLFRSGRDPAQTIEKFMTELTGLYGESFAFEFERGDEDGAEVFEMRVTNCFFKNFFARHGITEVTTVLCAADSFWMDQIDPPLMGLRSERTSLMSLGDDVDRFRVVETDDPAATNFDVLTRRRLP